MSTIQGSERQNGTATKSPAQRMRRIALEEHFTTPALSQYAHRSNAERVPASLEGLEERLLEFDGLRLEAMDKAGIELAVLSVTTPGVQAEPDARSAVERARDTNDFLARQIQRHPTRYAGFAHLPLQDVDAAVRELSRCVHELGFEGAMVHGHSQGHYLDEPSFYPLWECVQDLEVPVYLHPCDPYQLPHCYGGHPELLGATWSWTVETATHALRMVFGGTFDRFPKVKLILGHLGESLPYLLWRLDSGSRLGSQRAANHGMLPSEVIRRHIMVTTSGACSNEALLCALSALSEDNVMFSADYPYQDCAVAADFIDAAPIGAAQRAKICHGNAERLIGM